MPDDPGSTPPASLVADGGFEAPALAAGTFAYRPAGSAWTFSGAAGVSAAASGFTARNPAAPEGTQVAFLQGTGAMRQAVAVPPDGAGGYRLGFASCRRAHSAAGSHDFAVEVDGAEVARFVSDATAWGRRSATFPLAPGLRTIGLVGLNSAGGDNTTLIDDVSLVLVQPEVIVSDPPPPITYRGPCAATPGLTLAATAVLLDAGRYLGRDGLPRDAFGPDCLIPAPERAHPRRGQYELAVAVDRSVPPGWVSLSLHALDAAGAVDGDPVATPEGAVERLFWHDPTSTIDEAGWPIGLPVA